LKLLSLAAAKAAVRLLQGGFSVMITMAIGIATG